jgi:hypothetical protein
VTLRDAGEQRELKVYARAKRHPEAEEQRKGFAKNVLCHIGRPQVSGIDPFTTVRETCGRNFDEVGRPTPSAVPAITQYPNDEEMNDQ